MPDTAVGAVLTDGTGASAPTIQKLVKDFVADFLITASGGIGAANIFSVQDAVSAPTVAAFALGSALVAAGYRLALRWATT